MNAPFIVAQLGAANPSPPRVIRLTKPTAEQAVVINNADGPVRFDFTGIADEKVTFVHVGSRLVILFDNQATVTVEPFFGQDGKPLQDITFDLGPNRIVSGAEFATLFPMTDDQSILPAAGNVGATPAGANFAAHGPIDPLNAGGGGLGLLGDDAAGPGLGANETETAAAAAAPVITPTITGSATGAVDEDGLLNGLEEGPGDVAGTETSATGSLNIDFGADAVGRSLAFSASQPVLSGLTSGGQPVNFALTTFGGLPAIIGSVGADQVYIVTLDASPEQGAFTFTLLRPLDHLIGGTEESLILTINFIATDGGGDSANLTFSIAVNDDSPVAMDVFFSEAISQETQLTVNLIEGLYYQFGADGAAVAGAISVGTPTITDGPEGDSFGTPTVAVGSDGHSIEMTPNGAFAELGAGEQATVHIPYTVTDRDGDTDTRQITVTVTGTNDAPTDLALSPSAIPAGNAGGYRIGEITVTDPDDDTGFSFSVADSRFTVVIETVSGVDHYYLETTGPVTELPASIDVTVTDAGGESYTEGMVITLPVQLYTNDELTLLGSFATIQAAVDAASDGDHILIGAGHYAEQVVIDPANNQGANNIALKAVGDVFVDAPDVLQTTGTSPTNGNALAGIITVKGAENIFIQGITVDGLGRGDSEHLGVAGAQQLIGIAYLDASGTVEGVTVTGVREGYDQIGNQRNLGIYVSNTDPTPAAATPTSLEVDALRTITIANSTVTDFQKGAIVVVNAAVDIHGNTITGIGASVQAQNGIQVSGSVGSIADNTIADIGTLAENWASTNILTFNNRGLVITGNTITSALDSNGDVLANTLGIYLQDSTGGTVSGNFIHLTAYGVAAYAGGLSASWAITDNVVDGIHADGAGIYFDPPDVSGISSFDLVIVNGTGVADVIAVTPGEDTVAAGQGDDILVVKSGAYLDGVDSVDGGAGSNKLLFTSQTAGDTLTLGGNVSNIAEVDLVNASWLASDTTAKNVDASGFGAGLTIVGNEGANTLSATEFVDAVNAAGGDDTLRGNGGDDALDGGANTDTAAYAQEIGAGMIAGNGLGGWTVTTGGAEGADMLSNIEIVDGLEAGRFLLVGNGGFATIQAALDVAADGDTILIGPGTFMGAGNVNLTIDKALTIIGSGDGSGAGDTIIDGGGFLINLAADAAAGTVSFQNLAIVNAGNAGISAQDQEVLGTLSLDHVRIEGSTSHGLIASGRKDSAAYDQAGVQNVVITNSSFVDNAKSNSNSANIMLFEFDGDATITNVTASNVVTGTNSAAYGVQLSGVDGPLYNQKTPAPGSAIGSYDVLTAMGVVTIDGLDVSGVTRKASFYVQGYTDTSGMTIVNSTVDTQSTAWLKPVVIDPMADQLPSGTPNTAANGGSFFDESAANGSYDLNGLTVTHYAGQFNELDGTTKADIITGSNADDLITGFGGDDRLSAGAGDDTIRAAVGGGRDFVDGGTETPGGADTLDITGTASGETFRVETVATFESRTGTVYTGGGEIVVSEGANVLVDATGIEEVVIHGGGGADTLFIDGDFSGSALLMSTIRYEGGAGIDIVDASGLSSAHRVIVTGSGGNDTFTSGAGDDEFTGGADTDTLIYGTDFDVGDFEFSGTSIVIDCNQGRDTITGVERIQLDDTTVLIVDNNPVHYDGAYGSIGAALAAAGAISGHVTILLAAGTYNENITITRPDLAIVGQGDASVIQGTFETTNGISGSVADFLQTHAYSGGGTGVTIAASNVTLKSLAIDSFNTGIELGNGIANTVIEGVAISDTVTGIHKAGNAAISSLVVAGGSIEDSYIGVYFEKYAGGGDAEDVIIDGTAFTHLTQKGIYAETLTGTTVFTNIDMTDVGQYGGGTAFGAQGKNGNGIDINLKYGTYAGNIVIDTFDFENVGLSNGLGTSHANAAAISVKARDDAPSYSGTPATFTGFLIIQNGTIDGTSTGIRAGEAGKTVGGPAVTVVNVTIDGELHNALHGDIDNVTSQTMTVVLTDASEILMPSPTSTGSFDISGLGGADILHGGRNADAFDGGDGNDTFYADSSDTIIEGSGPDSGIDEVRTAESHTLGANIENLTLLDGAPGLNSATRTDNFENFDLGPITNGENGWQVGGTRDQNVVDDGGNKVFRMSSDPSSPDFLGPYSAPLAFTAGEPSTTADYNAQSISFRFKAVDPAGDNSRLEVDFGIEAGNDRNNFMVIEATAAGIRIAVNEPLLDGNWTTNSFTAFTGNVTLASGASLSAWHDIELRLSYADGPDNDVIQVYLDGQHIGATTTFENYRDALGGLHADNAEANQTNRIFFQPSAGGAPTDGPGGLNEGFLFDDLTTSVYDDPDGTGNELANVIIGSSGRNTLSGLDGTDTLAGGLGTDTLIGGADADIFKFGETGAANVDHILDYSGSGAGDIIDVSVLLDPNFTTGDAESDFIRLWNAGSDVKVQVDVDGAGGGSTWSDVAVLDNYNSPGNKVLVMFEQQVRELEVAGIAP